MKKTFPIYVALWVAASFLCHVSRGARAAELQSPALAGNASGGTQTSQVFQVSDDPRDQVWISVNNGIVTVRGSVGTDQLARDLIKRFGKVPNVRGVRNRLTVRNNGKDAKIAAELREALSRDPTTHAGAIGVTVYRGKVFFSGAVSSEEESARATELARSVQGVTQVSNGLRVGPKSPAPRAIPRTRTIPRPR